MSTAASTQQSGEKGCSEQGDQGSDGHSGRATEILCGNGRTPRQPSVHSTDAFCKAEWPGGNLSSVNAIKKVCNKAPWPDHYLFWWISIEPFGLSSKCHGFWKAGSSHHLVKLFSTAKHGECRIMLWGWGDGCLGCGEGTFFIFYLSFIFKLIPDETWKHSRANYRYTPASELSGSQIKLMVYLQTGQWPRRHRQNNARKA